MSGTSPGLSLGLAPAGADDAPAGPPFALRERDLRTSIRPTVAEVDLAALRRNVQRLRGLVGPGVGIFGVAKADAYGHGAVAVSRVLEPLCEAIAVSLVEEGLELRAAGCRKPVLVLGAYYNRHQSEVLEEGLTPVVYDLGELERFASAPTRRRARSAAPKSSGPDLDRLDVHLKIDTGMSRLGFSPAELPRVLERLAALPRLRVAGVCTHFANADVPDPELTEEQLRSFEACLAIVRAHGIEPDVIHAANTAATIRFPNTRLGAVRPGVALYGTMPAPTVSFPGLEPVLRLITRIMAIHEIAAGTGVSYGSAFRATRPSRIATLPLGYADGYPRHVRGAEALVRGRRVPIAGAVCMDMIMVDVTDVPGVSVGDTVTLIGRDGAEAISIDEVAARAGTVAYEIMCGISKRVPRLYRDDPSPSGAEAGG